MSLADILDIILDQHFATKTGAQTFSFTTVCWQSRCRRAIIAAGGTAHRTDDLSLTVQS
tara:strand:- start:173 stop:349 length:177 start_codon:yes stop_codon:yes gene_type:complete